MNYEEAVAYLYNVAPSFQQQGAHAYKPGLGTIIALDEHLGRPSQQFKSIHVGGTNGKGSCCHTLAAILQDAGLKVGLYTSPHLVDFRERIRINGRMIPKERVVQFVEELSRFVQVERNSNLFENSRDAAKPKAFEERLTVNCQLSTELQPSFFELTTALAFKYFAEEEVDVAVVEVGLGGRLDSTNILTPLLSIITNISFDHTALLGNTLEEIAGEKAGIIKTGVPVVIGEALPETRPVFEAAAKRVGTQIVFAEDEPEVLSFEHTDCDTLLYRTRTFGTIEGELSGDVQVKNTNTILTAIKKLSIVNCQLSIGNVRRGFLHAASATGLQGRWQTLATEPLVVCDTGHNGGGWNYLAPQLTRLAEDHDSLHVVFGMAGDKDVDYVLSLLPKAAKYYWAQASVRRAMPSDELQKRAEQQGLQGERYDSVEAAHTAALANATADDAVFVGGSSFVVADLLTHFFS